VFGAEDLYDLLEIIVVDGRNEHVLSTRKE